AHRLLVDVQLLWESCVDAVGICAAQFVGELGAIKVLAALGQDQGRFGPGGSEAWLHRLVFWLTKDTKSFNWLSLSKASLATATKSAVVGQCWSSLSPMATTSLRLSRNCSS